MKKHMPLLFAPFWDDKKVRVTTFGAAVFFGDAASAASLFYLGGLDMEPYREMYCKLFNAVTDALEQLMRLDSLAAINTLMDAQRAAEELYMGQE